MDGLDTAKYTYDALQKKYANFLSPAVEITIGSKTYTNKELPILNLEVEIAAGRQCGRMHLYGGQRVQVRRHSLDS